MSPSNQKAGRQYILNPRTGKYVLLDGKVGKQVLMEQQQTVPYLDQHLMRKIAEMASPKTQRALKATNRSLNTMIPTQKPTNYDFFLRTLQDAKVTALTPYHTFKLNRPQMYPVVEVKFYIPPPPPGHYQNPTLPTNFSVFINDSPVVKAAKWPFTPPPKTIKKFQEIFTNLSSVRISWNPELEKEWNAAIKSRK